MKFFYICALLLPFIVSAYPSRDGSLSTLKGKFRLNKIDDNVIEEVNNEADVDADVDLVPDDVDQMSHGIQNLDLSASPSWDGALSMLKSKYRLNKIDENVNDDVDADVDHVALDGIDQMPADLQNLDLRSLVSEIIGNLLKAKKHEVPDMSVASDGFDNSNVINGVNKDFPDSEYNLVPQIPIATDDLSNNDVKPAIFVFPNAEDNLVADSSIDSNVFYKNLKIKGLLNKINY